MRTVEQKRGRSWQSEVRKERRKSIVFDSVLFYPCTLLSYTWVKVFKNAPIKISGGISKGTPKSAYVIHVGFAN